ncbi:MAG TPA: Hpt domain-containing protein, partial [Polyangiales bacterium]
MSDDILHEFLIESRENLDTLDRELVALEDDPRNAARLGSVFRTAHTIKGTAGFFQFTKLEGVTHAGENLLSKMRDGVVVLESVRTTALLAMVDAIRELLNNIEAKESEGDGHYGALIEALTMACKDDTLSEASAILRELKGQPPAPAPVAPPQAAAPAPAPEPVPVAAPQAAASAPEPAPVAPAAAFEAPPTTHVHAPPPPANEPKPVVHEPKPEPVAHHAERHEPKPGGEERAAAADTRIRVDVRLLDKLMNLVGELVLARNQLLQHSNLSSDASLVSSCQRLNLITTELQEGVMKTRM